MKLVALSDSVAPAIERLQKHFTGFYSRIVDELPDGKSWLVWVGNSRLPGAYIVFNHETSESYVLALTHDQALKEDRLTPAEYFSFPGRNGGRLSARLWRPQNIQLPPLIVFCPEELPANIVRSVFQSKVQAFVKQGYAVLQINPRNSWGFGKDRRQQAENDWIRALQEDLDDAVEELVVKKVVNGSQVCLYGDNFGGVLALQVAALSKRFAAVATVNVPANLHRDDLGSVTNVVGSNPLVAKLGGWRESEKFAQKLSPTLIAPVLTIPALYLHDDESLKGRPIQDGREIRSALKNAKAAAEIGLAFSWSQYFKPPSQLARENAEISMKITSFFNRSASGVLR